MQPEEIMPDNVCNDETERDNEALPMSERRNLKMLHKRNDTVALCIVGREIGIASDL